MQGQSDKIKVLFILTALHKDGAVLSTLTTLKYLDRSRFQAQLFVLKGSDPSDESNSWNTLLQEINVIYGMQPGEKLPIQAFQLFRRLYKLTRNSDIIVGGLEMAPTFLAAILGKFLGKPSIGFVRNSLPDLLAGLPSYYKRLTQWIYPLLTRGIAISNGIKAGTEKLIPQLKGSISTVYIPIDIEHIRRQSALSVPEAEARQPYLLAVGRLMPQKGFDILLQAYALARKQGIQQQLIIVGEGTEHALLENLILQLGLTGHVWLAGFRENPYAWMKHADLFISSSRFEGFCRVLAEAQVVGTPVVSTDCPNGPSEVLQGGESGVLVQNEDPEALAAGVVDLLCHPDKMQELSLRGKARVEDFTLRAVTGNFEDILTSLYFSRGRQGSIKVLNPEQELHE